MTAPRSHFAEAADRLEHTIEELKARQYDATGTKPPPAPTPTRQPLNPDEAWAKSFATHSMTTRRGESASPAPGYKLPRSERPRIPDMPKPARPEPARETGVSGHIGGALGKPAGKRGLLARLFRGPKG